MSDFKPEVVSQLDDLIKRKGKPAQKPEEKQEKGSITQTSHEGVNINAQGDVHYHAAPQPTLPSINEMSKKDRKAFDEGTWDGIEHRKNNIEQQEKALKRKEQRRRTDKLNAQLYYSFLVVLFLASISIILMPIIFSLS